jgi:hypothetical protein
MAYCSSQSLRVSPISFAAFLACFFPFLASAWFVSVGDACCEYAAGVKQTAKAAQTKTRSEIRMIASVEQTGAGAAI